jgi:hypothetical protein
MPSAYTKKERLALKQIKARIAAATEALEKALASEQQATTIRKIAEARREIAAAEAERNEIQEKSKPRKEAQNKTQADTLLKNVQDEFPQFGQSSSLDWGRKINDQPQIDMPQESHSFTVEDITQELSKIRARLQSLGSEEKFVAARKYLMTRIDALNVMLREMRDEEAEGKRQEKAEQDNRDFLASEASLAPLRENLNARLSAGVLSLGVREKVRQAFLDLAIKSREKAKQAGNTLQGGIHLRTVFEARADWYDKSAKRLEVFSWDLNQEPPLITLDKDFWDNGLAISPSNLNFRGLEEKALVVYVARKYYRATNNPVMLNRLPDWPEPTRIPAKPYISLADLQRIEQQKCLEALEPIHFDSFEMIYRCETSTLESPHSKPLLLWGDGQIVDTDKEVLWDKRANGWRRMPEPMALEPEWGSGTRYEYEQNEYGDWEKKLISNAPKTSFTQDATGHFVPDSSMPNGQWKRMPLLLEKIGDHKPNDDRTEFRYGHWFTKADCEQADQSQVGLQMQILKAEKRTIADQIGSAIDDTTPMSVEESVNCWRKRTVELREQSQKRNA